jgi:hypothetical protein
VDLGTVITSHQDISGKQDKLVSGTTLKTINGQSLLGSGDIKITSEAGGLTSESDPIFTASPAAGIKSTDITNWNNKGTYSKPSSGIPNSDLAKSSVTISGKSVSLGGSISQAELRSGLGLGSLAYSSATIPTTDTVSG